ncbi:unnamed protein product [Plutella xylostella]|uniref:(diamondback moth) hypothetical protein n=1 Tax=Plutella xylostella TaxID=51655 RepID=A0A8S4FFR3_PLUXY|nr:unnamed protein product [Plutella xylostella]
MAEKSEDEILRTLSENLKRKHDQISDQDDPDKQFLMSLLPHPLLASRGGVCGCGERLVCGDPKSRSDAQSTLCISFEV